jgi:hypothetical protein
MEFRRREILGGLVATLVKATWAAPAEEKAMYGTIGKMTTAAGKRAMLPCLYRKSRKPSRRRVL